MDPFPHHYTVAAEARPIGDVTLQGADLSALASAPPIEFGGPGDRWSPEALLVAAVADCFVLTFRAVARASALPWISLTCATTGTLDRVDRATQFTAFHTRVRLEIPHDADRALAHRLIERAEHVCLVTNSLKAESHVDADISIAELA